MIALAAPDICCDLEAFYTRRCFAHERVEWICIDRMTQRTTDLAVSGFIVRAEARGAIVPVSIVPLGGRRVLQ